MSHDTQFEAYRPLLFSIAYRMLGTAMEAEDLVQDTYLRYSQSDFDSINSHKYYLTTIVTRLSINRMNSAQAQRESYLGNWLPEPILTSEQALLMNPSERASTYDSISMAFLVILEKLSPPERAVFLLREIFDYDYGEIAEMLEKTEDACRQLFSRAKKHIQANRPRFDTDPEQHQAILMQFLQAVEAGEIDGLVNMLAEDAVLIGDGGTRRGRSTRPIYGADKVVLSWVFVNSARH
jgi:RNA polymerase sigma-70 factor (ECF subfamily)